MIYYGSIRAKIRAAIEILRQVIGDIASFGMVSKAMAVQVEGWREADRLARALKDIADCETSGANGTVRRMAKIARDALGRYNYEQ